MPNSLDMNAAILFELPDFALCLQLRQRLQEDWAARVVGRSESRFVSVPLGPEDPRMDVLLQAVAHWADEVGLQEVRFHAGDTMSVVFASRDGV
jgi:hypothetical protein